MAIDKTTEERWEREDKKTMSKRYKVRDTTNGDIYYWTVEEILEEINMDRSEEWTDYDETDWQEGLKEWTDFELLEK